ncbi:MAG TPA: hypothetical protein VEA63_03415 [Opitutus sp.]|nr:hypothetical protein [Opitutus sp.]
MTNEEAKFILGGYRGNGRDASDTLFAEALKQAQADPGLGAWFAREQAHNAAVAAKLAEIAPPAGLREAILAGGRVSVSAKPWWVRREWLAMAAAVAVAIGVGTMTLWTSRATAAGDPLASYALADVKPHRGHGAAVAALQTAMKNPAMRLSAALPVDFAELERSGCRTVLIGKRPVLEVCFEREGRWFHCYIGRCEDFPELAAQQAPEFASSGEMTAATWANGTYRVVVAGRAGREVIERLL